MIQAYNRLIADKNCTGKKVKKSRLLGSNFVCVCGKSYFRYENLRDHCKKYCKLVESSERSQIHNKPGQTSNLDQKSSQASNLDQNENQKLTACMKRIMEIIMLLLIILLVLVWILLWFIIHS